MSFIRTAWACGGVLAVALGMAAEACSSSSSPSNADAGSNGCAQLSSCCSSLSASVRANSACASELANNVNSACAQYLAVIQATGDCTGSSSGSSSGSGTTSGSGTGTMMTSSSGSGTSSTSGTGTGSGSCEEAPTLFPETAAGVYCPFSAIGSGGKAGKCAAAQECCEPGSGTSTCAAQGSACPAGVTVSWECLEAIDCANAAGGSVCCLTGTLGYQAACGTEPGYAYVSDTTGTVCSASCTSADLTVCEQDSDCTSPQTCVPTKAKGQQFGHCSSNGM